jgi:hypothetical protein
MKLSNATIASALALAAIPAAAQTAPVQTISAPITKAEVEDAQRAWCGALVAIATEHDTKGRAAAKALAGKVLDSAYGYDLGPVLFKPTLTVAPQTFRKTRAGALAYFVGDDQSYASDTGFALRGWRRCESQSPTILLTGASALSMGNVSMWNAKGEMTTVDKTWGYTRGPDGKLRIVLHHSSLPYKPN